MGNAYNKVEVWLSTLNLNGEISNRELKLVRDLEALLIENSFYRGILNDYSSKIKSFLK